MATVARSTRSNRSRDRNGAAAEANGSSRNTDSPMRGTGHAHTNRRTPGRNALSSAAILLQKCSEIARDSMMDLNPPRIVVVGSTAVGKSSLLQALVGYDILPTGTQVTTRQPIEVTLSCPDLPEDDDGMFDEEEAKGETGMRNASSSRDREGDDDDEDDDDVSIHSRSTIETSEDLDATVSHSRAASGNASRRRNTRHPPPPPPKFTVEGEPCEDERAARDAIEAAMSEEFTESIISVSVCAVTVPPLVLIDLPGVIAEHRGSENDYALIRGMVQRFASAPNTIVVLVHAADVPLVNDNASGILSRMQPNPLLANGIGVLTKVDKDETTNFMQMFRMAEARTVGGRYSSASGRSSSRSVSNTRTSAPSTRTASSASSVNTTSAAGATSDEFDAKQDIKHGWIMVKLRSEKERNEGVSLASSKAKEQAYFSSHRWYRALRSGSHGRSVAYTGVDYVGERMQLLLFQEAVKVLDEHKRQADDMRADLTVQIQELEQLTDPEKIEHDAYQYVNALVTYLKSELYNFHEIGERARAGDPNLRAYKRMEEAIATNWLLPVDGMGEDLPKDRVDALLQELTARGSHQLSFNDAPIQAHLRSLIVRVREPAKNAIGAVRDILKDVVDQYDETVQGSDAYGRFTEFTSSVKSKVVEYFLDQVRQAEEQAIETIEFYTALHFELFPDIAERYPGGLHVYISNLNYEGDKLDAELRHTQNLLHMRPEDRPPRAHDNVCSNVTPAGAACGQQFFLGRNRHHCRLRGETVCGRHFTHSWDLGKGMMEPVCDRCYFNLRRLETRGLAVRDAAAATAQVAAGTGVGAGVAMQAIEQPAAALAPAEVTGVASADPPQTTDEEDRERRTREGVMQFISDYWCVSQKQLRTIVPLTIQFKIIEKAFIKSRLLLLLQRWLASSEGKKVLADATALPEAQEIELDNLHDALEQHERYVQTADKLRREIARAGLAPSPAR